MKISNITMAEAKKQFNAKFPKSTIKVDTEMGEKSMRDYDNKLIRGISTGVVHSPMDCTNVKYEKVASFFSNIVNLLSSLGADIQQDMYSSNFAVAIFTNEKGKQFKAIISEVRCRSTYVYDEGYQQVYFSVDFEKI